MLIRIAFGALLVLATALLFHPAIERFLRPVSYQSIPKPLLPSAIADGNPDNLWRRSDGQLAQA